MVGISEWYMCSLIHERDSQSRVEAIKKTASIKKNKKKPNPSITKKFCHTVALCLI